MVAYNMADVDRCISIAQRWLERGIALGDRNGEAAGRLRTAIAMTTARRDIARARDELSRALSIFEELGWKRGIAGVLLNRAILDNEVGNFADAVSSTERALEIFTPLQDARGITTALANLSTLHLTSGDGERALREANEALDVARAGGLRISEALAIENHANAKAALGKYSEAIRLGDEALAIHREMGHSSWSGRLLGELGLWHLELGDLDAARARIDQVLAQGVHVWAEWPQRFHWAAAQVLRACGDDARARRELDRARELVADLETELQGDELKRYLSVPWNTAIIAAHARDEWPSFHKPKRSRSSTQRSRGKS
jgi:tetratricopeptide (TPR) repeat protein